jgi:hypothetical protein
MEKELSELAFIDNYLSKIFNTDIMAERIGVDIEIPSKDAECTIPRIKFKNCCLSDLIDILNSESLIDPAFSFYDLEQKRPVERLPILVRLPSFLKNKRLELWRNFLARKKDGSEYLVEVRARKEKVRRGVTSIVHATRLSITGDDPNLAANLVLAQIFQRTKERGQPPKLSFRKATLYFGGAWRIVEPFLFSISSQLVDRNRKVINLIDQDHY